MKLVVIGAQWGDEGKGKMVDYLAEKAKIVVRFSGGANAGHTIQVGEHTYKLHLVPAGVISPGKISILGTGMVIDPEALFSELESIEKDGVDWKGRVFISDRAHLVLPRYKEEDKLQDAKRRHPLGTTGRGIGITFAQKAHRDGVRVGDLFSEKFWDSMETSEKNFFQKFRARLKEMAIDLAAFMRSHKDDDILFEGAQGVMLDIDLGTYPYVSSGYSAASGASAGGGVGPRNLDNILGVFKAYSTRVGNGPFPTEFKSERDGDLGERIREIGKEYGVTTGRPRRCGYLDLVALRYACWTNSIDSLILTHLDVYDSFDEIKVCTGYQLGDKIVFDLPSSCNDLDAVVPITRSFTGWKESISGCQTYDALPDLAKEYLRFIEGFLETPIDIISVGPERNQTFDRNPAWTR